MFEQLSSASVSGARCWTRSTMSATCTTALQRPHKTPPPAAAMLTRNLSLYRSQCSLFHLITISLRYYTVAMCRQRDRCMRRGD